ncbi:hypothetical protein ACFCWY_19995 [Streptomyces sp. NPDC056362]|uniref:hypothetical protein n=1 Tax=unclassified Streptomyces TaxID=2593676 RepID=UPI0035D8D84E
MNGLRQYFEDNPEIFAALVAAIAIVGGLLGSVFGAKIQARSGQDQASAAREAAQIAAEAQRLAALWTVRQVQVAEFVHSARAVRRMIDSYYTRNPFDGTSRTQLQEAEQAMFQKEAEIELIVPRAVARAAEALVDTLDALAGIAIFTAPGKYVARTLSEKAVGEDGDASVLARRALGALSEWVAIRDSTDPVERNRVSRNAVQAVQSALGMNREEAHGALVSIEMTELSERRERLGGELEAQMEPLVAAAREMLRSEDDIAPAVPQQRRWWQRAA